MTLTRAGELLLEHAESIIGRLSAARSDLESLDEEDVGGPIRVGAYQSVAAAILPLILQALGGEPGDVQFALKESSDDRVLLELLERGELDVAFAELPLPDGPLEAAPLISDPYVLLVDRDYPAAMLDRELTPEEVAGEQLITLGSGSGQARVDDAFAGYGLTPQIAHRVDDVGTLRGFVAAGLGSGLVPNLAVGADGRVAVPIESGLPPRRVAIAWHRDRLRTCTAGMFVDLAIEVANRLGRLR